MFELLLTIATLIPPASVDVWHDGTGMVVTVESEGRVQGTSYELWLDESI